MRYIRTTNNIAEFIETDSNGSIISARGFQFGELYYQIKNKKVTFYLNDQENPFRNDIWTLDIPFEMDGVVYEDEDSASAHLYAVFNDRFQEQLDQLKEDLAAETARAQQAEEDLGEEIDDERDRAISAETHLQTEITELSGTVATFDGRIKRVEDGLSSLTETVNDEIARSTAKDAEHDAQISSLTDVLNSEIQRALSAETVLHNEILAEESRAFLAESGITNNLNNEISRSTQKDAQHDAQISALTISLDDEIQRATEAENSLRSDLNDEIADRISGDTNLQSNIDAEVARATAAESALTNNLNAEILRSTNKDSEHDTLISGLTSDLATETQNRIAGDNLLQTNLNNEIARATSAETVLHNEIISERDRALVAESGITYNLNQEVQNRIADVNAEEARAIAVENELSDILNAEITRSTSKDTEHDSFISGLTSTIATETQNRINADNNLQTNITNEVNRATSAETVLHNEIMAERDRALAAESAFSSSITDEIQNRISGDTNLQNQIDAEVTRATGVEATKADKANAVASAEYVSSNKIINFKNINGAIISSINASDFVKDGMVNDAYVSSGKLVIVFNTDAGKSNIEIPITDIFNANNYYTKAEVDASQAAQDARINTISGNVNTLDTKINSISGSVTSITADLSNYYTKSEVDASQLVQDNKISTLSGQVSTISASTDGKQDKLIAGQNISIVGNVISATGGGTGTSYVAGNNIQINGNVISATDTKYTAGDGISISNSNVISSVTKFWCGTEQQWAAISGGTLDANTIYMVH